MVLRPQSVALGVFFGSLCWGLGAPLSWIATQELPSLEVASARCIFAFLGLSPLFLIDAWPIMKRIDREGKLLLVLSGLLLGIHFCFFIAGIAYASLTTSVTLVAMEPVLILVLGILFFKEPLRWKTLIGFFLCLIGVACISAWPLFSAQGPGRVSENRNFGNFFAIMAVLTYSLYYVCNRAFRKHEVGVSKSGLRWSFGLASIIYFFASLTSGFIALVAHQTNYEALRIPSVKTLVVLMGIGLIPTILGNTVNQVISRRAHPLWVGLMSPGATCIALIVGSVFLGQSIESYEVLGGLFIISGIFWTLYAETSVN